MKKKSYMLVVPLALTLSALWVVLAFMLPIALIKWSCLYLMA